MQLITLFTCLVTLAAAAPPAQRRDGDLTCFYMTVDRDWHGEGINLCQTPGQCFDKMPDGLSKQVSSAGPDRGTFCFLFSDINCEGDRSDMIQFPGYSDLSTIGWEDRAQSWRCEHMPWA